MSVIGDFLYRSIGFFCVAAGVMAAIGGALLGVLYLLASAADLFGRVARWLDHEPEPPPGGPAVVSTHVPGDPHEVRSFLCWLAIWSVLQAGGAVAWQAWDPRSTPKQADAAGQIAAIAVHLIGFALVLVYTQWPFARRVSQKRAGSERAKG